MATRGAKARAGKSTTSEGHKASPARPGSLSGFSSSRARILRATRDEACERGYHSLSVTGVIATARVSSKTFYESFSDVDDCFIAAYDDAVAEIDRVMRAAYMQPGVWAERVRSALEALLLLLDRERELAVLVFVEAPKARELLGGRRGRIVEILQLVLDSGRSGECKHAIPSLTDELVVEGALAIIRTRVASRRPLQGLLDELMQSIAYSYLGPAAAEAQLGALRPSGGAVVAGVSDRPEARLRVTYRTLRVLTALAERPGSSNRQVAQYADIKDPGQVSRLVSRLAAQGMIQNDGQPLAGTRKKWRLTEQGELLQRRVWRDLQENGRTP